PHVRIQLRVQGANGGESWIAEGRSHTALLRNGWTGSEIEPGTRVTTVGHPAKDGSSIVVLRRAYLPDGREGWGTRADDSRRCASTERRASIPSARRKTSRATRARRARCCR